MSICWPNGLKLKPAQEFKFAHNIRKPHGSYIQDIHVKRIDICYIEVIDNLSSLIPADNVRVYNRPNYPTEHSNHCDSPQKFTIWSSDSHSVILTDSNYFQGAN